MRSILLVTALAAAACTSHLHVGRPLTQQRELAAFQEVAAYPNSDPAVLLIAAQQFMAAHRDYDGYLYFHGLAVAQPDRPLLSSLEGLLQARVAADVALVRRVAWVKDAIGKLDRGAAGDPLLGGYVRGMVLAGLPPRFGKARAAIADLEASLAARERFPFDPERGLYLALASAHRTLGDTAGAAEWLHRAGYRTPPPREESLFGTLSVDPYGGFRFSQPRLVREAEGVYVAEGFDFANIAFLVDAEGVVAIDAGTTPATARAALAALRQITRAPIRYLVLTHSHWDHIGGVAALREPGTVVIAQANFASELARVRASAPPSRWFFGEAVAQLDVHPDRLIDAETPLELGGLSLTLLPAPSGETRDALFVLDRRDSLLFVGDAFMPYVGSPFAGEGSPEGYLEAAAYVQKLAPRRLIHGHPPLTRYFGMEAMPGLEAALRAAYAHADEAAQHGRPLSELLHDNFLPSALRGAPAAVQPYLVVRDNFMEQVYREHAGRWAGNGEGMSHFTRAEWAAALGLFAGDDPDRFATVADELTARGDSALALEIAQAGAARFPHHRGIARSRARALTQLRARYQALSPFRFIVYSEATDDPLPPIAPTP